MQRTFLLIARLGWRVVLLVALASIAWELHGIRDTLIESERAAAAEAGGDVGDGDAAAEDCQLNLARSSTPFIRARLPAIRQTPL